MCCTSCVGSRFARLAHGRKECRHTGNHLKETKMRKSLFAIAAVTLAASTFTIKADAMPLGGLGSAADSLGLVEKSQYFYGGRDYCWYPVGWPGPGFSCCGS